MNSPKTSVPQTSAPVAALRAALPTDANERVDALLERMGVLEREVEAFRREMLTGDWRPNHGWKISTYSVLDDVEKEVLRTAVRKKFPERSVLCARVHAELPRSTANRLVARLDGALEEAAEKMVDLASGGKTVSVGELFPGKFKVQDLVPEEICELGNARSLTLTYNDLSQLDLSVWKILAPELGKVQSLDLFCNDLSRLDSSVWKILAPELGKVQSLLLVGNGLGAITDLEVWKILAPELGKVRLLSLGMNGLDALKDPAAWAILAPELAKVRLLSLGVNNLGAIADIAVWKILAPELGKVRALDLGDDGLSCVSPKAWKILAPELAKVRHLNVNNNDLAYLSPAVWAPLSARKHDGDFWYGPESAVA